MKLLAVLLTSILAYAAGDLHYLDFRVDYVHELGGSTGIQAVGIDRKVLSEVYVLEEITGDDWTVEYTININKKVTVTPYTVVKFCDAPESIQDSNIIDLMKVTLGLDGQDCPIQRQVKKHYENSFGGFLDLENYDEAQTIYVDMMLSKADEPAVWVILTA